MRVAFESVLWLWRGRHHSKYSSDRLGNPCASALPHVRTNSFASHTLTRDPWFAIKHRKSRTIFEFGQRFAGFFFEALRTLFTNTHTYSHLHPRTFDRTERSKFCGGDSSLPGVESGEVYPQSIRKIEAKTIRQNTKNQKVDRHWSSLFTRVKARLYCHPFPLRAPLHCRVKILRFDLVVQGSSIFLAICEHC